MHCIRDEIKSHRIAREIKEDRKTPVQDLCTGVDQYADFSEDHPISLIIIHRAESVR